MTIDITALRELADQHIAGNDRDMRDEPECMRCYAPMDITNEPSAFCSGCVYLATDDLAAALPALLDQVEALEAEVVRLKALCGEACELVLRPSDGHTWTHRMDRIAAIKQEAGIP